jgi:hypothetical protein
MVRTLYRNWVTLTGPPIVSEAVRQLDGMEWFWLGWIHSSPFYGNVNLERLML